MADQMTMKVPFKMDLGDGMRSHAMFMEVAGEKVGSFLVHKKIRPSDLKWSVTHINTGYRVTSSPVKHSAIVAAERLEELADWSFDDPKAVKSWDAAIIEQVGLIGDIARAGGI